MISVLVAAESTSANQPCLIHYRVPIVSCDVPEIVEVRGRRQVVRWQSHSNFGSEDHQHHHGRSQKLTTDKCRPIEASRRIIASCHLTKTFHYYFPKRQPG